MCGSVRNVVQIVVPPESRIVHLILAHVQVRCSRSSAILAFRHTRTLCVLRRSVTQKANSTLPKPRVGGVWTAGKYLVLSAEGLFFIRGVALALGLFVDANEADEELCRYHTFNRRPKKENDEQTTNDHRGFGIRSRISLCLWYR